MNTRRGFLRSIIGAAAVALPVGFLARHERTQEAFIIAEIEGGEILDVQGPDGVTVIAVNGGTVLDIEAVAE